MGAFFDAIGNRLAMFTFFGTLEMTPADLATVRAKAKPGEEAQVVCEHMKKLMSNCPERALVTICTNILESIRTAKKDVNKLEDVKSTLKAELKEKAIQVQDVVEQAFLVNVSKISDRKQFDYDLELVYNHVIQELMTTLLGIVNKNIELAKMDFYNTGKEKKIEDIKAERFKLRNDLKTEIERLEKLIAEDTNKVGEFDIQKMRIDLDLKDPLRERDTHEKSLIKTWTEKVNGLQAKKTLLEKELLRGGYTDEAKMADLEKTKALYTYATSELNDLQAKSQDKKTSVAENLLSKINSARTEFNPLFANLQKDIETEEKKDEKARSPDLDKMREKLAYYGYILKEKEAEFAQVNALMPKIKGLNDSISTAYTNLEAKEKEIAKRKEEITKNNQSLEAKKSELSNLQTNVDALEISVNRMLEEMQVDQDVYKDYDISVKKLLKMIQNKQISFFDRFNKILTLAILSSGHRGVSDPGQTVTFNGENWFTQFSHERQLNMAKHINEKFKSIVDQFNANADGKNVEPTSDLAKGSPSSLDPNASKVPDVDENKAPDAAASKAAPEMTPEAKIDAAVCNLVDINVMRKFGIEHTENWLDVNDIIQNSVALIKSSLGIEAIIENVTSVYCKKYALTDRDLKKDKIIENLNDSIDSLLTDQISNTIGLVKTSEISRLKESIPESSFLKKVLVVAAVATAVLLVVGFVWVAFLGATAISTAGIAALLAPEFALQGSALVGIAATLALLITGASQKQVA